MITFESLYYDGFECNNPRLLIIFFHQVEELDRMVTEMAGFKK